MTLDNISSSVRRKSSNHGYILLALLPKAVFLNTDREVRRTLRDRVFHMCLRLVLEPLRRIAREGAFMSDPLGSKRWCFTTLSMYMVDLPEATKLAGVTQNCSPVSVAVQKEFGASTPADRRWFRITKDKLEAVKSVCSSEENFFRFVKLCRKNNLTGVEELIWDGWDHSEPPVALSYDLLHSGHKFFFDHILEWCKKAMPCSAEIDNRFKALHPRKGWKYFYKGISGLKRITGRDYRNLQRLILCVIDGIVPNSFTELIRIFLDSIYIAQKTEVSESDLKEIQRLQNEFHSKKKIVIDRKYRDSSHFQIPKLEIQWAIVFTIAALGNLLGLSTDITEHEHIQMVKEPFRRTNHKDFYSQMLIFLQRMEKLRHFDMATALLQSTDLHKLEISRFYGGGEEVEHFLDGLATVQNLRSAKRPEFTNYFALVKALASRSLKDQLRDRTFIPTPFTAIHLNRDPSVNGMTIEDAGRLYGLPDLYGAIVDYYTGSRDNDHLRRARQRGEPIISRGNSTQRECRLPFDSIKIWYTLKVQTRSLSQPGRVTKPSTICAEPPGVRTLNEDGDPNEIWIEGRYDFALFINDMSAEFHGKANLKGESLIFHSCQGLFQQLRVNRSLRRSDSLDIPANSVFNRKTALPHLRAANGF